MEDFWSIIRGWTGFWQFVFLWVVVLSVVGLIRQIFHYGVVAVRGWPPATKVEASSDDDENGISIRVGTP